MYKTSQTTRSLNLGTLQVLWIASQTRDDSKTKNRPKLILVSSSCLFKIFYCTSPSRPRDALTPRSRLSMRFTVEQCRPNSFNWSVRILNSCSRLFPAIKNFGIAESVQETKICQFASILTNLSMAIRSSPLSLFPLPIVARVELFGVTFIVTSPEHIATFGT